MRSPSVDIVHDPTLAARLRAAGVDPAALEPQLAVQLETALHVSVVVHLPGGRTVTYDARDGERARRCAAPTAAPTGTTS